MQLGAAALFVVAAVYSVVTTLLFVNHDTMLRALQAQGTQFPAGTDMDSSVNVPIAVSISFVICIGIVQLVAPVGSYLGSRSMFCAALLLFGPGGLRAL